MSMQNRDAMINSFNTDPDVTVFLLSLKAGGVALNLTAASHVMCAPCAAHALRCAALCGGASGCPAPLPPPAACRLPAAICGPCLHTSRCLSHAG